MVTAHTPRFTARAPNPRDVVESLRLARCTSVAKCDIELTALALLATSSVHPDTKARVGADIDAILDRRTQLAFDEMAAEAIRLARE